MEKELSIIIPYYNGSNTIDRLLDSIPYVKDIEIIIIDDKSSEKELNYLLNCIGGKYKHISFYKNDTGKKGAGVCRNIGLKKATGRWLLFADSDDFFANDFIKIVYKYYEKDSDIVFFTPKGVDGETMESTDRHLFYSSLVEEYLEMGTIKSELRLRAHYYVPWSKLIRREFVMNNDLFFDECIVSNDVMFSTKAGVKATNIEVSKESIYYWTVTENSLTTKVDELKFSIRKNVFINWTTYLKGCYSKEEYQLLDITFLPWVLNALKYGFGVRYSLSLIKECRQHKIDLIQLNRKNFNVNFIKKKLNNYINVRKYEKVKKR